ncbi:multidrug DMT transporter permease [Arsukibacterium sp. MJ3]|uniref:DMT family transporter n=1 Tax=Arsukibacterium sp. MJ3 TaxID=1632859 RepID=UPI00062701FA|nr:DMT family transporter [Arsukibacterium sp. MJ3]KKO48976.1 multidrug DMT transporter permease [Arsukibacterium sp. MJ3]
MQPHLLKGALLLLLAEACFAGIGAIVKYTSDMASEVQIVFFRNLFALLLMLPFLYRHGFVMLKTQRWYLHVSRALTGLISMYCFFYVLSQLPLAQAMMIIMSSPFIVPILARFWLNERPSRTTRIGIVLGFIGVVLALPTPDPSLNMVLLLALFSAFLVAITKTTIRAMASTESAVRIVFYFSLLTALMSAIPVPFYWQPLPGSVWLAFIGMGILAAIGQLAMTNAFAIAPASDIGMWTYSSVLFAGAFGYFFWQEPVTWGWVAGVIVIFYAGYVTTRQRLF